MIGAGLQCEPAVVLGCNVDPAPCLCPYTNGSRDKEKEEGGEGGEKIRRTSEDEEGLKA
jgi:hypothetical protein